jgi:hypothetical protein
VPVALSSAASTQCEGTEELATMSNAEAH